MLEPFDPLFRKVFSPVLLSALLLAPTALEAQQSRAADRGMSGRFHFGVGQFGLSDDDLPAPSLDVAYRVDGILPWSLEVQAGVVGTTARSAYGYGGILRSVDLLAGFVITGSLGAGFYRRGQGADLGSALEFRSSVSLGWELANGDRISVYLYHLSNAGIGDRNPGVEVVGIGYTLALW